MEEREKKRGRERKKEREGEHSTIIICDFESLHFDEE
jgi:hypothetical protein